MSAIGLIELSSIAAGMQSADMMLKTAAIDLILSRTICAGKYMVLIGGDVASIQAAVDVVEAEQADAIIDTFVIPSVHPDIFPALNGTNAPPELEALGILESFSVASLIEGADEACKAADVKMIELRLAMALGGKAFCTMTGDVAAVTSAVEAGAQKIGEKGMLVNKVVIPNARPELLDEMV